MTGKKTGNNSNGVGLFYGVIEMENKVFEMLNQLATKLNTTVEHLWGVLVNQASIESISYIVLYGMAFIMMIVFFIIAYKTAPLAEWNNGNKFSVIVVSSGVLGTIILVVAAATVVDCFPSMVSGLFNPEYWALEKVTRLLK